MHLDPNTPTGQKAGTRPEPSRPELPSFAKALFHGHILSDRIVPFPRPSQEETEILKLTLEAIEKFGREVDTAAIEESRGLSEDILRKLREMGLFGLIIPEAYGGFGLSNSAYIAVLAALGMIDTSITATIGAHQSIGLKALLMFGTDAQKEKYLPRLASGEWIAGFGLTEPGAGSDVRSLRTSAELGPEGTHYLLNGNKIWITNGGIADFFTVFARTRHPDRPEGKQERITAFLVTRDMEGFSSGPEEKKMGLLGSSTTELHFDNVRVPVENVIGEPGEGFKVAMAVLNNGRLGLAGAVSLGMKRLIQQATDHALQRRQFGQPLAEFGLIQQKIAGMLADNFAAESMVRLTAAIMDEGKFDYSVETAMCKVFCTEAFWNAAHESLQIAGGAGYMKEYGYEKVVRDSRIFLIWEGANEVLRLFTGLSGLQGPGEQLRELSQTLRQPLRDVVRSFGVLSDFGVRWLQKRVGPAEKFDGIHPSFDNERERLERYVVEFSKECERTLMKYGKDILHNQQPVQRLSDIAMDLFAMACTLARASQLVEQAGEAGAEETTDRARLFCRRARRRVARNLRAMARNDDDLERKVARAFYESGGFHRNGYFF